MGSFTILQWLFIGAVAYLIYMSFGRSNKQAEGEYICPHCGTRGDPVTKTKGSLLAEIVLWLCFILPGLIYSIWRQTSKYEACPACDSQGMIPVNSPNGKLLAEKLAQSS